MEHKGYHERGYLPHRDVEGSLQSITFREADSVPIKVIENWKSELSDLLDSPDRTIAGKAERKLRQLIARYEDAGHGHCHLKASGPAGIVENSLLAGHPEDYRLIAWCVMPNHVHLLVKLTSPTPLGKLVQKWKGGSSVQINRLLKRRGTFWAPDYHDRAIRNEDHYWNTLHYIHQNPVKAGLVASPEQWPFSSAGKIWNPDA